MKTITSDEIREQIESGLRANPAPICDAERERMDRQNTIDTIVGIALNMADPDGATKIDISDLWSTENYAECGEGLEPEICAALNLDEPNTAPLSYDDEDRIDACQRHIEGHFAWLQIYERDGDYWAAMYSNGSDYRLHYAANPTALCELLDVEMDEDEDEG